MFGTNILQIREVIANPVYSPVPQAPANIDGLMNLRGQVVSVINVAEAIGLKNYQKHAEGFCLILKTDAEIDTHFKGEQLWIEKTGPDVVGLLVEEMGEVRELNTGDIDTAPANSDWRESAMIKGVAGLEQEIMMILSLEQVTAV